MASRLLFSEKWTQGTKQGAKLPEVSKQGREISVFLAFSRFPSSVKRIEQDLRRRTLYPAELPEHNYHSIVPKNSSGVNKKSQWISIKFRFIFHLLMHILWRVICVKGVK